MEVTVQDVEGLKVMFFFEISDHSDRINQKLQAKTLLRSLNCMRMSMKEMIKALTKKSMTAMAKTTMSQRPRTPLLHLKVCH